MMKPNREQLETLAAVVDAGTFDAAATRLGVTPSAVSQRIKAFEQELGRVLVVRSKPVQVTESGRPLVRLARQLALLEHEANAELGLESDSATTTIPLAVNADSMATWFLPAVARAAWQHPIAVELHREDQERTAALLASGTVMAAVTAQAKAVPGCTVVPLGGMTYRPVATPEFAARWFADGVDAAALARAPFVVFDRNDELQSRFVRTIARRELDPPRHFVPASADFAQAVVLGLGWGMLPDYQADGPRASGRLVELVEGRGIPVALYWQQWNLRSPLLDAVAAEVLTAAREALDQPRRRR
jgi:LysR family transcriptional regulator (chromosome initiation inhibitor)